jgi:hypothetical protein
VAVEVTRKTITRTKTQQFLGCLSCHAHSDLCHGPHNRSCSGHTSHVLYDDDLQWVRSLAVPMHLGLIDRPFVPHNLISAQGSPVPLSKFPPRLRVLRFSGSKKLTQIYCPFLSKVPASESPPGSRTGPLWRDRQRQRERERPAYRPFLPVFRYISLSQRS